MNIKYLIFAFLPLVLVVGCSADNSSKHQDINDSDGQQQDDDNNGQNDNNEVHELLTDIEFPETYQAIETSQLRPDFSTYQYNAEAVIPPQCYTKHDDEFNPCMTCHQTYEFKSRPNQMADGDLQQEYAFSDIGVQNHWSNLFEDRSERIAEISDQEIIDEVYRDNYSELINTLKNTPDWDGPIPEIENLQDGYEAFDDMGLAKDGSYWVAFNYKPLPSTFWPTNGSTDDVIIRLPEEFRSSSCDVAEFSKDTYYANLSIVEMAVKRLESISTPEIDESVVCADLNGDGLMTIVTEINRPDHYVGNASDIEVSDMLYPVGTQMIHTVRYIGVKPDGSIFVPPRIKELRYMKKHAFYSITDLDSLYGNERQEKIDGLVPKYTHLGDAGTNNGFGWTVQGFIEASDGSLRLQSAEEHLFCMGCHTTIGTTIDQTFAFPRKVTGAEGWGYIDLKGMRDAPNVNGTGMGEIHHYLTTVGGGNEFRENKEIRERFFDENGNFVESAYTSASDVYDLITPSVRRALDLNKAYLTIVRDQDFIYGRDANLEPANNVYEEIDNHTPVLPDEKVVVWDLRLDW